MRGDLVCSRTLSDVGVEQDGTCVTDEINQSLGSAQPGG
jgi:hypothetical protein